MVGERLTTDSSPSAPGPAADRSMLITQYALAAIALVAAVLLAGVR